jgi:hypothetical protein
MTSFGLGVLWTVLVTATTLMADRIAGRLVVASRCLRAIRRAADQGATDQERLAKITQHLEELGAQQAAALSWGANLATVALALDLAALGLAIREPGLFPFFGRWSTAQASNEIMVWRVVLLSHLALLFLSICFKHLHTERGEVRRPNGAPMAVGVGWIRRYKWVLLSNSLGFLTLLSSFVVLTSAV